MGYWERRASILEMREVVEVVEVVVMEEEEAGRKEEARAATQRVSMIWLSICWIAKAEAEDVCSASS